MRKSFFRLLMPAVLLAPSFVSASEAGWDQADFSDPRFDPAVILKPEQFPSSAWATRLQAGDKEGAVAAVVEELRHGPSRIDLEQSIPKIRLRWFGVPINHLGGDGFNADDVVNLRYVGVYGIAHQFEGEIDWLYDGSQGSTPEWIWQMNRHLHWINLADAYQKTRDGKYARAWERELRSWIAQCPRPEDSGRRRGSAWRSLDTGIRAGSTWPYAFEIFRHSPHVSDEAIWLLFAAQRENALHLERFPAGGNWIIMETNGLGHAGLMFPEMAGSGGFVSAALERAQREMSVQFFADGTHQEFAPHYAAAGCIANFYALARLADRNRVPLPDGFWDSLALFVTALARIADPHGIAPPLHNSLQIDMRVLHADVVASRSRGSAVAPWERNASDLLPHGGYAVFRRPGTWALFNAGPRGTAHFHDDDLQLLTYAHGRHFAVDPGSPRYTNEPLSQFLRTSAAHNVVLMDSRLHEPANKIARPHDPLPFSFHGEGPVQIAAAKRFLSQPESGLTFSHERVVLDVEDFGWLVLDRLTPPDQEPRGWEWIWNMAVDEATAAGRRATASVDGGPSMTLITASGNAGEFSVSRGIDGDQPRGWMNRRGATEYLPIPALRYLIEPAVGPVWAVTWHAPHPDQPRRTDFALQVQQTGDDTWQVEARREGVSFSFLLSGGAEITRVRASRGGDEMANFRLGGHTLQP